MEDEETGWPLGAAGTLSLVPSPHRGEGTGEEYIPIQIQLHRRMQLHS
ncbi:hypothetical protein Pan97_29630 [Bremerella volcania]|uniref:Uncharacterized protein n=1 Tax=Bremerella volcania TaxID=2527984 RepID=A0A518C9M0_9BACT|nr:hypothetical protein Pan97_29630 [Bremerella volcania]